MKILAIGDIHTKLWIIKRAEELIDYYDKIVFVGDYADDWNSQPQDTMDTWKMLKAFQEKYPDKVCAVMGNHDYIYTNYTKTTSSGYNRITQMILDIPENRELRNWLHELPITLELDGVTYSHAGLNVFWSEGHDLWDDDSPIWARPSGEEYQDIPQVFGHTPSETCWEVKPNVWCIDTFSTYPNGDEYGDNTVLEIVDGKKFKKIEFKNGNNITNRIPK